MNSDRTPIEPCAERCPALIRQTLDLIASKWTAPIFIALYDAAGPVRYADIARGVGNITPKELAKNLRHLEAEGLISRRVYPTVPPRVEYSLTGLGESIYPTLEHLAEWALHFGGAR